jgi:signal transduction histidine kinase
MHNAAKYSQAEFVELSLVLGLEAIELTIEDSGQGFDTGAVGSSGSSSRGLGLTSMQERVELSGGVFSIESTIGEGTNVKASWDLNSFA